jgi:hypothetical protein
MYQTVIAYTKGMSNIPNGHKIYQLFSFQGPTKYDQNGSFGLNMCHLAAQIFAESDQIILINAFIQTYFSLFLHSATKVQARFWVLQKLLTDRLRGTLDNSSLP